MPDHRSKRQKLEAMADQTESPHEAKVARTILDKLSGDLPRGRKTKPFTGYSRPVRFVGGPAGGWIINMSESVREVSVFYGVAAPAEYRLMTDADGPFFLWTGR